MRPDAATTARVTCIPIRGRMTAAGSIEPYIALIARLFGDVEVSGGRTPILDGLKLRSGFRPHVG